MSGMFFSGFLFISTHLLLDLISPGSAETNVRWDGKLSGHLLASCITNILTKNYQNQIISFQVILSKNVGDVFLRHSVHCTCMLKLLSINAYSTHTWYKKWGKSSLQGNQQNKPNDRRPLPSIRPTVTIPATQLATPTFSCTNLYC